MIKNEFNKNSKVVAIGVVLILAVSSITVAKHFFRAEKDSATVGDILESQSVSGSKSIANKELLDKIKEDKALIVVDLRDPTNFKREHILNSKNVLLEEIKKVADGWDKNKNYVFIGYQDLPQVSLIASQTLENLGFKQVTYLVEGFEGWKNEFNPTISEGDPTSLSDQSKVNYINSDELKKAMEGEKLYIIDLRKSESFKEGHLKDAVNLFLDDLESNYRTIPLGKKVILYDKDGLWAFKGAVRLFDIGVLNVFALSDGLDTWKQKGFEVVR